MIRNIYPKTRVSAFPNWFAFTQTQKLSHVIYCPKFTSIALFLHF